jgi:hypothetical protein
VSPRILLTDGEWYVLREHPDAINRFREFREDNRRLEALLHAKDEAIGELLELAEYQPEPVVIYRRLGA